MRPTSLRPCTAGRVESAVVRVSWTADQPIDAGPAHGRAAFDEGAHRVEAYVDPDDVTAQRVATVQRAAQARA